MTYQCDMNNCGSDSRKMVTMTAAVTIQSTNKDHYSWKNSTFPEAEMYST